MFGHRFFGARYFGARYFGPSTLEAVTVDGALAASSATIDGEASSTIAVTGVLLAASAGIVGAASALVSVSGALSAQSSDIDGEATSAWGAIGDLQSVSASIDGAVSAAIAVTGDLQSASATIDGVATPDQISEFLHPDGEVSNEGWTGHNGSATIHQHIDEGVASDLDYGRSPVVPAGEKVRVSITNPVQTVITTAPIVVRYRIGKTIAGPQVDMTVRLFEGVTEIAEWSHPDVAVGFTTEISPLTQPQIDAITDFDDLALEFEAAA